MKVSDNSNDTTHVLYLISLNSIGKSSINWL